MADDDEILQRLRQWIETNPKGVADALTSLTRAASAKAPPETAVALEEWYREFNHAYRFEPGQLVRWKRGMKNKARPDYGQPCIVVEQLDKPISNPENDAGSPFFLEKLDIGLGVWVAEVGQVVLFYFDGRRFEPYTETLVDEPASAGA